MSDDHPDPATPRARRGQRRRTGDEGRLFAEALRMSRLWLGARRRRLWIAPPLAVAIALAETGALVFIASVLLAFAEGADDATVDVASLERSFSFGAAGALAAALIAVATTLRLVEARLTAGLAAASVHGARVDVLRARLTARWEDVRTVRLGDLQRLIGTNAQQAAVPVLVVTSCLSAGVALLAYLSIVVAIAPALVLIGGLIASVVVVIFRPLRRRAGEASAAHARALADLQLECTTYVGAHRELEGYGVQEPALTHLRRHSQRTAGALKKVRFYTRALPPLYQQLLLLGVLGGVLGAREFGLDATAVGTAALLLLRSVSYVQMINNVTQTFIEARPFLRELRAASRMAPERTPPRAGDADAIELHGVSFAYAAESPVLSGIDLRIEPGERVAITGPSGGGKSTLLGLIAGTLSPTMGEVRRPAPAGAERSSVLAQVPQDPTLLRATVLENVRFHRTVDDAAVGRALALARLTGEVDAMAGRRDTIVGDGASALSGGQRQRLAIARALVLEPRVLLLDEPSSALDADNERALVEVLAGLPPDVTVVVVTHRPALLSICDRQIVVEEGRIAGDRSRVGARQVRDRPS